MKQFIRFSMTLAAMVVAMQAALANEPATYYKSAVGKSDEALMSALNNIIHEHREVSYSAGLLSAFATADTDEDGYIIDIYSTCRYATNQNGASASELGQGYNREHSFPRSWFGGAVAPMNTDVFHIYPTDIHVNSQRGNNPYGVCKDGTRLANDGYVAKGKLGTCTYPGYSGVVFEPDDEYKGDLARTYFYMATCYKEELPGWPGSAQIDYSKNKYLAFSTWTINMLMEWTRLDPVSEKEINRNEAVYGIQGNRNPFIDHPELAEYIWGDKKGEPWPGSGEIIPASITQPENLSVYDMGTTTVGTELEYTVTIKGVGLSQGLNMSMSDNEFFYVSKSTFSAADVNRGTTFVITFTADEQGTFSNDITLRSDEVSTSFTITATATKQGDDPVDPVTQSDSIMEDWEGCETGGYWNETVVGHAWIWEFANAGIWQDNLCHGERSCRLGKDSNSAITMTQDQEHGTSAISLWAGSFGNDADATLNVDYSTDKGSTWTTLGSITVTKGELQPFRLDADVEGAVRFRIAQTSGVRVNIDDITLYSRPQSVKGDANGDGEVNIADVNAIIDAILKDDNNQAFDTNGDGEVNIADVNMVIDIILAS